MIDYRVMKSRRRWLVVSTGIRPHPL